MSVGLNSVIEPETGRSAAAVPEVHRVRGPARACRAGQGLGSFEIVKATTRMRREQAYRLRYQVYCIENGFEDPARHPGGFETDEFDSHSVQSLLIHRESGAPVGAVRLILPLAATPERSFPIQNACDDPLLRDPGRFPVPFVGEVSRFCISKQFRKRRDDAVDSVDRNPLAARLERRVTPHFTLALIEALIVMSIEHEIAYWCALMEPGLMRLLARLGIHFDHIGPMVECHGLRQPGFIRIDRMFRRAALENMDAWDILTGDGERWDAIRSMPGVRD